LVWVLKYTCLLPPETQISTLDLDSLNISTLAGNSQPGSQDGNFSVATFDELDSLAMDRDGVLYAGQ